MLMKPMGTVIVASPARSTFLPRHVALALALSVMCAGLMLGCLTTAGSAFGTAEHELLLILRFMAVVKLAMALAAALLLDWRLGYSASPGLAGAYLLALGLMAAAPGLIWAMAYLVPAAVAFHGGILLALFAGLHDGQLRRPGA
jgi:hypothetical protein